MGDPRHGNDHYIICTQIQQGTVLGFQVPFDNNAGSGKSVSLEGGRDVYTHQSLCHDIYTSQWCQ